MLVPTDCCFVNNAVSVCDCTKQTIMLNLQHHVIYSCVAETVALRLLQSNQRVVVTTTLSYVRRGNSRDLAFHLQVAQHESVNIARLQSAVHACGAADAPVRRLPVGTQPHARPDTSTQDSLPRRQIRVHPWLGQCELTFELGLLHICHLHLHTC